MATVAGKSAGDKNLWNKGPLKSLEERRVASVMCAARRGALEFFGVPNSKR
jgi:hypothetical protein